MALGKASIKRAASAVQTDSEQVEKKTRTRKKATETGETPVKKAPVRRKKAEVVTNENTIVEESANVAAKAYVSINEELPVYLL